MVAEIIRILLGKIDGTLGFTLCDSAQSALAEIERGRSYFKIYIDLDVAGAHGMAPVRQFAQLGAAGKCVIISAFDNPQWHAEAIKMKLLGYLLKTSSIQDLASSLLATLEGKRTFQCAPLQKSTPGTYLTRRQQDILCLLHRGYLSKEIATQLGLNIGTVNNHVIALLRALNVSNRAHAIAKAMDLGYLQAEKAARPIRLLPTHEQAARPGHETQRSMTHAGGVNYPDHPMTHGGGDGKPAAS